MADDKIRITRSDVHSTDVDARVKRQEALNKTQQHLDENGPTTSEMKQRSDKTISKWFSFYNPLVYMTLFGLAGGLFAWMFGEIPYSGLHDRDMDKMHKYNREDNLIQRKIDSGALSLSEGNNERIKLMHSYKNNPYMAFWLEHEKDPNRQFAYDQKLEKCKKREAVVNFLFYTLVGTFLGLFLGIADAAVCRNVSGAFINGTIGAILGLSGGVILSLFIDRLFNEMGGGDVNGSFIRNMLARSAAWGLIGLFLALAPGIVLRSYKRCAIGLTGGLLGGLLGGMLFDPVYEVAKNDVVCRLVALCAIGGFVGIGTGILENAAKSGWLQVTSGLIAGKQFILYRNPTVVGSSPHCEIFVPVHGLRSVALVDISIGL
jgi:hypothetical protein